MQRLKTQLYKGNRLTASKGLIGEGSRLKNGIWPRSVALWMAAFYVALFVIRPWEELFPWLGIIHFERIYAICMIIAVLFTKKKSFQITFQTFAVIIFLCGIGLAGFFSIDPSLSWEPFYEYCSLVVFYFILILVIRDSYELIFVIICYVTAMGVYLVKAQWEFWIHGQHLYDMGVVRLIGIESTYGSPNSLSMSIVVSLPLALFLWSYRNEITLRWPKLWQKLFLNFLALYSLLTVSSVILTNSRSGMLSFVLFVILSASSGGRVRKKFTYILVGAFILGMIWSLMPEENKGRFKTIWDKEAGPKTATISARGRIEGFNAGLKMFERFPLTGVGIGNFISYRVAHLDGIALSAHNLVGQVLGETGAIGGITFLLLVSTILVNCRRLRALSKIRSDGKLRTLSSLGIAFRNSLFLLIFEGLFGHNLFRFNWLWLAAFSSLAVQYARHHVKNNLGTNIPGG